MRKMGKILSWFGLRKKSLTAHLYRKTGEPPKIITGIRKIKLRGGAVQLFIRRGSVYYASLSLYSLIEVRGGGYGRKVKLPTEGGRVEGSF
jgi:hypothetical protein